MKKYILSFILLASLLSPCFSQDTDNHKDIIHDIQYVDFLKEKFNNYIDQTDKLKNLSSDQLSDILVKKIQMRNDIDDQYFVIENDLKRMINYGDK